jgi:hypothetical protein
MYLIEVHEVFFVKQAHPFDFTLNNFSGLLCCIGVAENEGSET